MMEAGALPSNIIRCMNPEDRKALGVHTVEEYKAKSDDKAERVLQAGCENYLRLHGIEFLHISMRAREKVGWPDLVWPDDQYCGCRGCGSSKGHFCAVELKTSTGQLSTEQKDVLLKLQMNGARVAVIRSLEDFIKFFNGEKSNWPENV